jgi:hypothetical protein
MRWRDYLAACDPADAEILTNALTVGFGTLATAARQTVRNEECRAIVAALGMAQLALQTAATALAAPVGRRPRRLPQLVAAGVLWQAWLARWPPGERQRFSLRLYDIVTQAGLAGELTQTNGDVNDLAPLLSGVLEQIDTIRLDLTIQP